jgi:hypothetical protein
MEYKWKGEDKYHWSEDTIIELRESMDCSVGLTIDLVEQVNQWIEDNISNEYEEDYVEMGIHLSKVLIGDVEM